MDTDFILSEYIKQNFDGILVIGDVHADYEQFNKAVNFAKKENFFLLSLGDLVDCGSSPFEVIECLHRLITDGRAGLVIGNHDNKMLRYSRGSNVRFSLDALETLSIIESRKSEFFDMYVALMTDPMFSGYYVSLGDLIFSHGAFHIDMLDADATLAGSSLSLALFGETNGKKDKNGFPIRLYSWVDSIPAGKTSIVGHDRKAMHNVELTQPLFVSNASGGKAVFLDTGCGKGGHLSGLIVKHNKKGFILDSTISFED